jgi:hypothetical protein
LPAGFGAPPPALPSGQPPALPSGQPALPAGPVAGSGPGTALNPSTTYGVPANAPITGTTYSASTYGSTTYGAGQAAEVELDRTMRALPAGDQTIRTDLPSSDRKSGRKRRPDPCAGLRAECEQLRELATSVAAAAAQAATEAESAHAAFVTTQLAADEARRALEDVLRETTEVSNQIAQLERTPSDADEKLQAETSHAAFAAYRRGDISAEQLREVFKRAEGWTPEHDRLSHRSNELRAQETELIRIRDAGILAEQVAGDAARTAAITARSLDEEARTAAVDARGRCAAADACERGNRRR